MAVFNAGSINIDHVYAVDHFVQPGETLASRDYRLFCGGKGFNQSIALARAGAKVHHVGCIGSDGDWLRARLQREGVDTRWIQTVDAPTGHAIIQVVPDGENSIIITAGANNKFSANDIPQLLNHFTPQDTLLLQNEINGVADFILAAAENGQKVSFNPAPMTEAVKAYPLDKLDCLILNAVEAAALTGETEHETAMQSLHRALPKTCIVLTLGKAGAWLVDGDQEIRQPAFAVQAVDTTAAGDTFIGFFLAERERGGQLHEALKIASRAASICVTRRGAADSIPQYREIG
ncbi:MAG TPA: ribokinase [bacterium]|jgi:ribokinase|nr:ribokinase [bacterium]HNT64489.1 ribokinase [bacterium]